MVESASDGRLWMADRAGQNWKDQDVLAALEWLSSLVPSAQWQRRTERTEATFQLAKARWAEGDRVPLFADEDTIAWYVHQAQRYADPQVRPDFFLPLGYRIAPLFRRLGQLLPKLKEIEGGEERAARLMTDHAAQPDDAIYELLVAGAYSVRGWPLVRFVPEAPGVEKRPDLIVERKAESWAVECKRAGRHGYFEEEREAGERLARRAHQRSAENGRPLIVLASFLAELPVLPEDYLAMHVERFLQGRGALEWQDEGGSGVVYDLSYRDLYKVLQHDDIYFGSSRMVDLLLGRYDPVMDFSMEGVWTPAQGRPLHATWVNHASLVVWRSRSEEAARRKARHFRGLVARASSQLLGDRPGAVHVGYEAVGGNSEDGLRHHLNKLEIQSFDPGNSELKVVYGNYFRPELVTAKNESAAVSETLAWYPVGAGPMREPLPKHMLFADVAGTEGSHL